MTTASPQSPPAFRRELHPAPISVSRRDEIHAAPGFGRYFTDHMVLIDYDAGSGWHDPRVVPYGPLTFDPATMVLHYGQEIFEGLKCYAQPDGSLASFRPEQNAARLNRSAVRLGIPQLPEELFLASLRELLAVDGEWVPTGGESSLYLRPFIIATEVGLGVRPSASYLYCVIASPAGAYFPGGVKPVSVWWSTEYVRAAPGGTGAAKFGGNYAASLAAQAQAAEKGCDQVVWLDAVERRWVEEMGGMNLFFVFGSGDDVEVGDARVDRFTAARRDQGFAADDVPGTRLHRYGTPDLHRRMGREGRKWRADRGFRLRDRRGDHPGRVRCCTPTASSTSTAASPARSP